MATNEFAEAWRAPVCVLSAVAVASEVSRQGKWATEPKVWSRMAMYLFSARVPAMGVKGVLPLQLGLGLGLGVLCEDA